MPVFLGTLGLLTLFGSSSLVAAVPVRFLPLTEEVAGRKIGVRDSKGLAPLRDLTSKKRSKVYSLEPGKAPLALVALDRERPNGNPASVEIELAADLKSPLILILPDSNDPSGIRMIAMEDGVGAFPWGSLRFINTTDKPYMVRCERDTTAIPASSQPVDIAPGGEARNIGVQVFSEAKPDEMLYSAVWEHDLKWRKLILVVAATDPAELDLTLEIIPQDQRAKD